MWEHNCTSNPAPAYRGTAGHTESQSACGYLLSFLLILENAHLPKQDGPYLWTSTACVGYRNWYQGPSLYRFRKVI